MVLKFLLLYLYLNKLSERFNKKIVIALHPRVEYKEQYFDSNFQCFKGKTVDLIIDSSFVIYHFSESFNYVAFFKKPTIFITLNCLEHDFGYIIRVKASAVKTNVTNISQAVKDNFSEIPFPTYNESVYTEYVNKFLPSDFEFPSISEYLYNLAK